MSLVRCVDVARTFGQGDRAVVAVHGCSCEVAASARIAITGSSGSGKSTLLHLLAGLEVPTSGTVSWPEFGTSLAERGRDIAVVFQGPSLLPALDVLENAMMAAVLTGIDEAEAVVRGLAALQAVGISDLSNQLPETLSGGQAQRVAVARALTSRPRLLLADEPTGQLDGVTGRHVMDVLLAAADELGAALVVSTHDPAIAARLAEQWEMRDGRLFVPVRGGAA
ncbi:ATP-binding cassette domain-containing protein [Kribbella qitaiheensis]|uniref:ATP-binding cassette domain-containing protein n=1 Tax=Kribbella qitaiheensis TaxID=1544730 RepID=A0A7G6X8U9_9ACTN|nr:ATP-binding cassette domain-containing protein [Kribbella qitaiheensis]QNE22664.1 ATP-binding cassette domain-containing protein [Kribbella qitaiheensis]